MPFLKAGRWLGLFLCAFLVFPAFASETIEELEKHVAEAPGDAGLRLSLGKAYLKAAKAGQEREAVTKAGQALLAAHERGERSDALSGAMMEWFDRALMSSGPIGEENFLLGQRMLEAVSPPSVSAEGTVEERLSRFMMLTELMMYEETLGRTPSHYAAIHAFADQLLPDADPEQRGEILHRLFHVCQSELRKERDPAVRKVRLERARSILPLLRKGEFTDEKDVKAALDEPYDEYFLMAERAELLLAEARDSADPAQRAELLQRARDAYGKSGVSSSLEINLGAMEGNIDFLSDRTDSPPTVRKGWVEWLEQSPYTDSVRSTEEARTLLKELKKGL